MIGSRRVLAVVPARGGSKGLPGKHLLEAGGRPLIAWTIAAANGAKAIDRTVLSSDDEAIMAAGRALGCDVPFRRPAELATDAAASIAVVLPAGAALPGYAVVVRVPPPSPLRRAGDIEAALEVFAASGAPACVSVAPVVQSPYWMYRLGDGATLHPVVELPSAATRRQDLPAVYALNGAVYIADIAWLRSTRTFVTRETVAHVMPAERSVDIDTAADFEAFRKAVSEDSHA